MVSGAPHFLPNNESERWCQRLSGLRLSMFSEVGKTWRLAHEHSALYNRLVVNRLHLDSAFLTSCHSKHFMILPNIHPLMHTFTPRRRSHPRTATASSLGAVRVGGLVQGHLETRLVGAGDRTSTFRLPANPPPPEPHAAHCTRVSSRTSPLPSRRFPRHVYSEKPWMAGLMCLMWGPRRQ